MAVLTQAGTNLFTRPPEEHFHAFEAMQEDARAQKGRCETHEAKDTTILSEEDGDYVHFGEHTLRLNPYAPAQLAAMAKVLNRPFPAGSATRSPWWTGPASAA